MTILIKGYDVRIEMEDGRWVIPAYKDGIIHDPEGTQLSKCAVYVGPYKMSQTRVALTKSAKAYFGPEARGMSAKVDVPDGPWESLGKATQIRYFRTGTQYQGKFFHFFQERTVVHIAQCGKHYRIGLPDGCVVNWRGFVYP